MIVERIILLWVQHFEQRTCWVTAHVHAHLVDLIQQKQWVNHCSLGHFLHDFAGHRADVGTSVATYFGFVTNAAEGHADELTVCCPSNALAQTGLAHSGWTNQA